MPTTATFDGKQVEYVEVHDEPIHRRQFSNEYVYVYIAGIRQVWTEVRVELGDRFCRAFGLGVITYVQLAIHSCC